MQSSCSGWTAESRPKGEGHGWPESQRYRVSQQSSAALPHREAKGCFFHSLTAIQKNDNAHVEQKNWSHVRQLLSYDRLDQPELVPMINDLYANEWSLYQNRFCPSFKLVEKTRINSKYRKKYDKPKTPYQRVMESKDVSKQVKQKLKAVHLTLDPFILKAEIERKLKRIFQLVKVTSRSHQI
jgi:hypothetical protein